MLKKLLLGLVFAWFGAQPALAQTAPATLDGEPFTKQFVGAPGGGDRFVEFVREAESFERWTKLIGFRYQQLPGLDNDPIKFANAMAQLVKRANPNAHSSVLSNPQTGEAILDFLTWPRDLAFMEFNVFRFTRSQDGKAVVSVQFAHRLTGTSDQAVQQLRQLRQSWVQQAAAFDMGLAHDRVGR